MTNAILSYIAGQIRSAAVIPTLWAIALGLFAYVMSRNYRHIRNEKPVLNLDQGEREVGRIHVRRLTVHTHTLLTSRRVIQGRFSWFLSKRKIKSISLDDVHSIVWRRYSNWVLLVLAIYFLNSVNPVALLLLLFGLQSKIYSVRFGTPFAQMPDTRIVVTTTTRRQLAAAHAFYEHAVDIWSRMIVEKRLASAVGEAAMEPADARSIVTPPQDPAEDDFAWGAPLLLYIVGILLLAVVQRLRGPHVSFDDYLFGPVYVGLVAGVAVHHRRDALWLALLASIALFTIKFPGSGILTLAADGGSPFFEEYAVVLGTLLLIAGASSLLGSVYPILGPLAVIFWALVPPITSTGTVVDFSLFTKLLLGMFWAIVVWVADEQLRDWFAAREDGLRHASN